MPALRIIGNELLDQEEFETGGYAEKLQFDDHESRTRLTAPSPFAVAPADGATATPSPMPTASDDITPLPPIAFGQPLTVDIRHVYSGRIGYKEFLGPTGDIAVVSGVKDWSTFKASARALNFVAPRTGQFANLTGPSALDDGSRIVAYQKAVVARQINVGFELVAAPGSSPSVLEQLGSAFKASAGVPLFLPYAGALLAAGQILPFVGDLIEQLSRPSPWSSNVDINFGLPGTRPTRAEFQAVVKNKQALAGYRYEDGKGMVDASGRPYTGSEPYIVIAIYGGSMPELELFTPSVMSAELAQRFYQANSGIGGAFDDLLGIIKVASDVKYRQDAEALQKRLSGLDAESEEAKKLEAQLKAVLDNIIDPTLRPKRPA
ncbi:MAG: hypothetical protein C0500_01635 [Sphingobium sp.]|nr:hypothetical protein [Sphingobium sp.]